MSKLPFRLAVLAVAIALVAAASGSDDDNDQAARSSSTTEKASSSTTMQGAAEMTPLPDFAKGYKTAFTSPASGFKLTANTLKVTVAATGFDMSCTQAGKPVIPGKAHYHLLLDKSLINMYCTSDASVSMQNVKPGPHELEVVPALNDHAEVMDGAQKLEFDYEPTKAMPVITDQTSSAKPTIKITSPKPGETVKGPFDVVVDISNFEPSCDLFGKPAVAGYGHWHVNLDSATGPMMGMGTMLGMSCEKVFHADTEGLKTGETHTVIALLTDNGHAPLDIEDKVEVKVG
jgi:hypothetical protein